MRRSGVRGTTSGGGKQLTAQFVARKKGTDVRSELLRLLLEHSYEHAEYPKFKLSSGIFSDTYINCKTTTMLADAMPLIGEACCGLIPPDAEAIGGLTMGADAIAANIASYLLYAKQRRLNYFVVRKTPKEHGTKLFIEGNPGRHVVVVDDVVTTGGSTITAIQKCREANIEVLAVIVLVDREESNGLETVQKEVGESVPVHAIFRKSELERAWRTSQTSKARPIAARSPAIAY